MFRHFFCLECEENFQDTSDQDEPNCPYCDSPNVMEDSSINDYDGHFEGDLYHGRHGNSDAGDD